MKHIYLYFLILFNLFLINLTLESQPNIIWENIIHSYDISSPSSRQIYNLNDKIFINYSGYNRYGMKLMTSSLYEINLNGDTLNHISFSFPNLSSIIGMMYKNDSYYFLLKYDVYIGIGFVNEPVIYKYDSHLKNFEVFLDTLYPFAIKFPVKFGDSLVFVGYDDENEYYCIRNFDEQLNYYNEIILDTNGINIPHSWRIDPGFMNGNGNYTIIVTSDNYNWPDITKYGIIVQFNKTGKVAWSRKVASPERDSTLIEDIFEDKKGNIVATGITRTGSENQLFIINKYSPNGEVIFEKTQPMHKGISIWSSGNLKYSDGYYVCGTMDVDSGTIKGNRFWLRLFDENGAATNEWDWKLLGGCAISDIIEKENGNLLVYGSNGGSNLYLAEINPSPISVENEVNAKIHNLFIYPNPLLEKQDLKIRVDLEKNSSVKIDLINCFGNKIFDIFNDNVVAGEQTLQFSLPKEISKGIYWIRTNTGGCQYIEPIIVE